MSTSIGSSLSIQPAAYTYTPSLPTGIDYGSNGNAAPGAAASSSTASTATSSISQYESEYDSLQSYDNAELLSVSFGSQSDAASNVDSVLAQAASLQDQQNAAAAQQAAAAANAAIQSNGASTDSNISAPSVPSYDDIINASDSDALSWVNQQVSDDSDSGSSINTYA